MNRRCTFTVHEHVLAMIRCLIMKESNGSTLLTKRFASRLSHLLTIDGGQRQTNLGPFLRGVTSGLSLLLEVSATLVTNTSLCLDGSNNGLRHFLLCSRDPVGGKAHKPDTLRMSRHLPDGSRCGLDKGERRCYNRGTLCTGLA